MSAIGFRTNRTASKGRPPIECGPLWRDALHAMAAAADVVFGPVADDATLEGITTARRDRRRGEAEHDVGLAKSGQQSGQEVLQLRYAGL